MEWLFDLCCKIMSEIGESLGFSYKEICVIGNIYVQGGLWLLSALLPVVTLIFHKQPSYRKKLYLAVGYGVICSILFILICVRYSFPITEGFDVCVNDLHWLARTFGTTYQVVNIYIFVIGWLLSVVLNITISKQILRDYKTYKN